MPDQRHNAGKKEVTYCRSSAVRFVDAGASFSGGLRGAGGVYDLHCGPKIRIIVSGSPLA